MLKRVVQVLGILCATIPVCHGVFPGKSVGKLHCNNPMVTTTSFQSTQFFSLTNFNNRTKDVTRSGSWKLTRSDQYTPAATSTGSPMLKVVASTVEIDLNGMEISYTGTAGDGYIGIEVGYAPSETGTQPTDVVIKNGTIKGFDLGILVHAGVKNVMFENVQILNSSVGVLLMGKSGDYHSNAVVSCVMNGVCVIGHGANRKTALVNLKALLEDASPSYNYGANSFMPLRDDAVAAGVDTVHTYMGIAAIYARDLLIVGSCVQGVGYNGADEGNSNRTEGVGIVIRNSTRIGLQNSYVERSASQTKAVGLQLEDVNDVEIIDCQFNSTTSATQAVGIELFSESAPASGYLAESIHMQGCECNFNYSDDTAMGANFSKVRDLHIVDCQFNRNNGKKTCYGLYSTKLHQMHIDQSSLSTNFADNASLATKNGAIAAGLYLAGGAAGDLASLKISNVDASGNIGTNSGRGIYVNDANALFIEDTTCCLNEGTSLRTDENTDLIGTTTTVAGHNQSASVISKHLGVLTHTGGVGIWLESVTNALLTHVRASYNQGLRATGILGRSCIDCEFIGCVASSQQATGDCFHTNLASQSNIAFPAIAAQQQLLYGGDSLATIDMRYATDKFLVSAGSIKTDQANSAASEAYSDVRTVVSAMALLQAAVARYRVWGTAVGMHLHNCQACFIDKLHAMRNISTKDSAMGIAFTGEVEGCIVRNSELSYNIAWQDSKRTASAQAYNYTFEMQAVHPFWDLLANEAAAEGLPTGDGQWERADSSAVQGFDDTTTFVAQGENLKIRLDTTNRNLVNPVGGVAVGCLLGDAAFDILVENNVMQGNNGHSGQAYGILMNVVFLPVIRNNRIYYTSTNSYGFSYGIAEFSAHATSASMNNELSANKAGAYFNANYMVPFDATDVQKPSMSYQIVSTFNGDLDAADVMKDKDSLEVKYSQDPTFYGVEATYDAVLHDDLVTRWDEDAGKEWTA